MPILLFFLIFGTYLYSLPGTISAYRDSGDLISAASTLGIAHPPGYPTYVVLGRLWKGFLPWANAAYGCNVMSALSIALAAALLLKLLIHFFQLSPWRAGIIALFFALTPAVWSLGQVSEMYALASLFAVGILLATYSGHNVLAWFLFGLGLGVHPTLVLLLPFLLPSPRTERTMGEGEGKRSVAEGGGVWIGIAFFMGISIFLFLPLRASMDPLQNWGNPSSWRNFWRVVTRADYGGLRLHPVESQFVWSPTSIEDQLWYFVKSLAQEWGWLGVVLAAWGFLQKQSRRLALSFLFLGPVFFVLSNLPIDADTTPAILQPYLVLASVVGVIAMASALRALPSIGGGLLLVLLVMIPFVSSHPMVQRNSYYAYDYGRNLLRLLPPKAVLFEPDDPTAFTLRMFQVTEQRRTDVVLLNFFRTRWGYEQLFKRFPDLLPSISFQNAQELEQAFWSYSIHQRPFYAELPQKFPTGSSYTPHGLVYPLGKFPLTNDPFVLMIQRGHFVTTAHPDFFTKHLLNYYASAYSNTGLAWANQKDWSNARENYFKALLIDPELTAAYNNLGILEFSVGHESLAKYYYLEGLKRSPKDPTLHENLNLLDSSKKQLKS